MKRVWIAFAVGLLLLLAGPKLLALADEQGYYITDSAIGLGGGERSSESFTVEDTLGAAAVGTLESANFKVESGLPEPGAVNNTYIITANAGAGGSIAPSGAVSVNHGSSQTFTITPNPGYHISGVLVDSTLAGAVTIYTFNNITTGHNIVASFALNAVVDIDPNTLNLKSQSDKNAITAYIELPSGHDVGQINVPPVKLSVNGVAIIAQLTPTSLGDYDGDKVPDRMVKFDRQTVINALGTTTGDISIMVMGQLNDGRSFSGRDTISVINPRK